MTGKTLLWGFIGLACLILGIAFAFWGIGNKVIAYSLVVVGALLFLGTIVGMRRVISLIIIAVVSILVYYAVLYLLGVFGVVVQSKGKTAVLVISALFVYILSSSFARRT